MLVDSHCHLNRLKLAVDQTIDDVLHEARQRDIKHFLCVSVSLDDFKEVFELAKKHDDVTCSVGVHPSDHEGEVTSAETLIQHAQHPKVVAFGETGLDYFYGEEHKEVQQTNFREHVRAARDVKKPLIIHTRMACDDTLTILRQEKADEIGGVMHCFTEHWDMAKAAMDLNFYISISGIVTFKKAEQVQEVAKQVPLDRLLVETDSPYLAPVPYRGKSNVPTYVREVAEYIADLRGISFEALAQATTENFQRLFLGNANV